MRSLLPPTAFFPASPATARYCAYLPSARWVSRERRHPDQQGEMLADGSYRLVVPYAD